MDNHTLQELQYNRGIFFILMLMVYSLVLFWAKPEPVNLNLSRILGQTMGVNCHETDTDAEKAICAHYCGVILQKEEQIVSCMVGVYEIIYEEPFNAQEIVDPTVRED